MMLYRSRLLLSLFLIMHTASDTPPYPYNATSSYRNVNRITYTTVIINFIDAANNVWQWIVV